MMYRANDLKWNTHKALIGYKLCAYDCFGNEFARIDLKHGEDEYSPRIAAHKANKQKEYNLIILGALRRNGKFIDRDHVQKTKGSWWEGLVVGFYSTKQTPEGYAVQLNGVDNGPVQIYPAQALEKA